MLIPPHSLPHRSGAVINSSPVWNLSRSNKESDASSIEDGGQAYVVGEQLGFFNNHVIQLWL